MKFVHDWAFERGPVSRLFGTAVRAIGRRTPVGKFTERVERAIKNPIFGCETCGMCRLAATQYVCPETCPKGLANGPCGGTAKNLCEFRDRECIHSAKYPHREVRGASRRTRTPDHPRRACRVAPHLVLAAAFQGSGPGHQGRPGRKAVPA
ncbi:methylenetetrahydrofolate reductase C-terminal domain-containing protein [Chenggangzhangella methanolivorans]|uniref:Methylenetetrahydrofolate reductase C-terminal domain-containing protein n=1 Tax=Chenggangzhangella methanolivorans TaxID=1437009 RepID=A0A9E6R6Z6_9HYPH|nr:methylenetetrahydrofolate reductase C-terminal domain-containing protein [Chenggangzhangella methanolivorans]